MPTTNQCRDNDSVLQEKPVHEIPGQVEGLERELDGGHEALSVLVDRLSHVLRPSSPDECGENETQAETELGQQMQLNKTQARRLRQRIADILERLEV